MSFENCNLKCCENERKRSDSNESSTQRNDKKLRSPYCFPRMALWNETWANEDRYDKGKVPSKRWPKRTYTARTRLGSSWFLSSSRATVPGWEKQQQHSVKCTSAIREIVFESNNLIEAIKKKHTRKNITKSKAFGSNLYDEAGKPKAPFQGWQNNQAKNARIQNHGPDSSERII